MPKGIDLTGEVYGDFTVIEMLHKRINGVMRTYCKCLGIDDKEYIIRADALRSGATKYIKGAMESGTPKDITGQKFGHLTALYPTEERAGNGSVYWHCKCDCGDYIDVTAYNLLRGHTRSCGCHHRSKYEEFIHDYLASLNIEFEEEKRFPGCTNAKGSDMLPFDFYIPEYNLIIEYDGQHHFEPVKGWGGENKFKLIQENDNIKNKYCKENGLNLLRIPYTDSKEDVMQKIDCFMTRNDHSLIGND